MNKIIDIKGMCELSDDTKIARYFSRRKLQRLMKNQEIWFSNASRFADKTERKIPEGFFVGFSKESEEGYRSINAALQRVIKAYMSCWTKFDDDNYALWKIYDRYSKGACLVTTVGKLKKEIERSRSDVFLCKVDYINMDERTKKYERPWIFYDENSVFQNMRVSEKYKMKQYHYEEEIRAIAYLNKEQAGFGVKVDLKSLINEVYVSPFSSNEESNKTINILKRVFDENIIKDSKINE